MSIIISANIYPFKVNNNSTRKRCEICSKLIIKIPEKACNYVLTPRAKVPPHPPPPPPPKKSVTPPPPPVLKFFNPPSPQTFYSPFWPETKIWRCEANAQTSHPAKLRNYFIKLDYIYNKQNIQKRRIYKKTPNDLVVGALDSQSKSHGFKTIGWLQGRVSLSFLWGRANE